MVTYAGQDEYAPAFDPKDPDDTDTFRFDFSLDIGGATITTRTITIPTGITDGGSALALSDKAVDVTLSGGTDGFDYEVAVKATYSDGRVKEKTGTIPVRSR